jgi:hypothetical protein
LTPEILEYLEVPGILVHLMYLEHLEYLEVLEVLGILVLQWVL